MNGFIIIYSNTAQFMTNQVDQTKKYKFGRGSDFVSENVKFSTKIVKLLVFYNLTSNWKKYLTAFIVGIFMAVGTSLFIEITGLYAGGSAALLQGVARLVYVFIKKSVGEQEWIDLVYNILFWGMYFILNLFLFAVLYEKLNRQCIIITFIYLVTTQLVGFGIAMIPHFQEFTIFGNTQTVNEHLREYNVQCIIYNPNIWPTLDSSVFPAKYDWSFEKLITDRSVVSDPVYQNILTLNIIRSFLLVVYAFTFSIITSICNAVLYIIGGSSAGTEMVALYVSEKKNKDVTIPLKFSQTICLIIGGILGSYITGIIICPKYYSGWQYIINANMIGSFIWILANAFFLDKLFPSQKVVKVEIFTQNVEEVVKVLKKYNFTSPSTIVGSVGGYSGVKNNILMTVLSLFEVPALINVVREIDKKCLITANLLVDCDGNIAIQRHKHIEKKPKKDVNQLNNLSNPKDKATSLICKHLNIDKKEIKSITLQTQGWTNKTFLFKLKNNKKYIVRIAISDKLLDRNNEMSVLKLLANNSEYAFLFIDEQTGNFIRKYIEGKIVPKHIIKNSNFLKLLASKLKQIHSIKIPENCKIKEHDNHQYDKYITQIDLKYQKMYNAILEKNKHLKKCLCHHDLTPWNIIYDKRKNSLSLIDFEWSRISSYYFDLANFIREANIHNTKYEKIFLDAYNKEIDIKIIREYLYITSFFSYLWTYSMKAYKHILAYRAKTLKFIKRFYQEIIEQKK